MTIYTKYGKNQVVKISRVYPALHFCIGYPHKCVSENAEVV